jgi:hypothetical protein
MMQVDPKFSVKLSPHILTIITELQNEVKLLSSPSLLLLLPPLLLLLLLLLLLIIIIIIIIINFDVTFFTHNI